MKKTTLLMLLLSTAALACGEEKTEDEVVYQKPQAWAQSPLCGLSYNPTEVSKSTTLDLAIRNDGREALTVSNIEIIEDDRGFLTSTLGLATAPYKESALVRITYKPTAAGWDRARLKITSNAQNYPTLYIPILALASPAGQDPATYLPGAKPTHEGDTSELCPTPPARAWTPSPLCKLSAEPTKFGSQTTVDLAVRNDGTQPLTITAVGFEDDSRGALTATIQPPATAAKKQSVVVRVTYKPTATGWDRARLKITSNAENSPLYVPVLALAYPDGQDPATYNPGPKPTDAGDTAELCPSAN